LYQIWSGEKIKLFITIRASTIINKSLYCGMKRDIFDYNLFYMPLLIRTFSRGIVWQPRHRCCGFSRDNDHFCHSSEMNPSRWKRKFENIFFS